MNSLPDDPYLALGLSKDATAAEIRKVYLKLVVKSHPDKFQDPVEKAKKADEFHKIQQAYELLSDDSKRAKYHEELKLAELRREMGKTTIRATGGVSASTTTTFSYNVHNAEPRPSTFTTRARDPGYRTPTRSYEDIDFDIPLRRSAKKPSTSEKIRPSVRDDDRRHRMDDDRERERDRERREKESQKSNRSDRKKSRDKELKRGSEDKFKSTRESYAAAIDPDDEFRRSLRGDRRSPRSTSRYVDDYIRPSAASETERKMSAHLATATQYTEQVRMKEKNDEPRAGISRTTTYNEEPLKYRYVDPKNDATPRHASVSTRPAARRTPEAKPRDSPRSSKDKKSYNPEPRIISVPDPSRPPPLKSNRSDPQTFNIGGRKEPSRSKTFASPKSRKEMPIPTLSRAKTWQERGHSARVDDYSTSDSSESSEDDEPGLQRRPNMPTRQTTTYKVDQQRDGIQVTRRAPEDSDAGELRPRVAHVRPPFNRTGPSGYERAPPVRSQSQSQQPFAPRTASPENYPSSKVSERPKYFQQPPYGEQINIASYDFNGINVDKGYRRATSDRYPDEQRSRHTRGSVY